MSWVMRSFVLSQHSKTNVIPTSRDDKVHHDENQHKQPSPARLLVRVPRDILLDLLSRMSLNNTKSEVINNTSILSSVFCLH